MVGHMRPMLVNQKQKVAALASGLAIATTGFVVDAGVANAGQDNAANPTPPAAKVLAPDPR